MSSTLFNIYLMDLEAELRKEQAGGMVLGKEKFWSITYADDIVLTKSEQELKSMMSRLKKYIDKKGLILSPEKSKVVVFERGRGKSRKREWKWGEEKVEEVKEIRYLGYIMQKNGGAEKHKRETKKSCDCDETNVKHRRKTIQRGFREKGEDVQCVGGQCGTIWNGNMGMEKGRKVGQSNKKIYEMDLRIR